jgi:murein DD-endopeptidase MepM/ murein hydrolase activator NlpD
MARASLLVLLLAGCTALETIPDRLFDRRTARERYEAGLEAAGLAGAALVRDWSAAGARALSAAPVVTLPVEEQGYFAPGEPAALSWRVAVRRGQRLTLTVTFAADSTARLFLDVWRDDPDSSGVFERVIEADSGERHLTWSPRRDDELVIRAQPELLRGGRFSARLAVDPVLAFPVEKRGEQDIRSRFGAPRDGGRRDHHGVDIFAPRGTPVLAGAAGTVRRVATTTIGGNVVWLRDRDGHSLYYAHLDRQSVTDGQEVEVGDTLGFVGNTGNARTTPPHLHFGIYARGEGPLDPWYFLHQPRTTAARITADTARLGAWLRTPRAGASLFSRPAAGDTAFALPAHTPLRVLAAVGEWFRVRLPNGETGYVVARTLETLERPLSVGAAGANLDLVSVPFGSETEVVVKELDAGKELQVFGYFEDFALVRTDGVTGWVGPANRPSVRQPVTPSSGTP